MATLTGGMTRAGAKRERMIWAIARDISEGLMSPKRAVEEMIRDDGIFGGAVDAKYLSLITPLSADRWRTAIQSLRLESGLEVRPVKTFSRYGAAKVDDDTLKFFLDSRIKGLRLEHGQFVDIGRTGFLEVVYQDAIRRYYERQIQGYKKAQDRVPEHNGKVILDIVDAMNSADALHRDSVEVEHLIRNKMAEIQ